MNPGDKRVALERWLDIAVAAVDPEALTADALSDSEDGPTVIIAIGKAAAGMCRGAHRALGPVSGVCVTNAPGTVPDGIDLLIGDHPIPGDASFEAGKRVLEVARAVSSRCVALISGGGSALCEQPVPGVDQSYLQEVNALLLDGGASIEETNLVRRHLSAIKCGGVARAVRGPLETYVVSDVGGAEPGVVASGPTIPTSADPTAVKALMRQFGIPIPEAVWDAINQRLPHALSPPNVTVLADGKVAARAVADAAQKDGFKCRVNEGWIAGPIETALEKFFAQSGPGVTVGVGEPTVDVRGNGAGGRNSHAALLASTRLDGHEGLFASFATDGIDGRTKSAGAIVDGATVDRGGDPENSLRNFDSATYLNGTGDLIRTGPTGTNVADLWVLWRS
ncbi:MAG: glycerate kinase [Acidimicrobiia bacterium]